MTGRLTPAVRRALARVQAGATPYRAAKEEGIALSTIYRAIARQRYATHSSQGVPDTSIRK